MYLPLSLPSCIILHLPPSSLPPSLPHSAPLSPSLPPSIPNPSQISPSQLLDMTSSFRLPRYSVRIIVAPQRAIITHCQSIFGDGRQICGTAAGLERKRRNFAATPQKSINARIDYTIWKARSRSTPWLPDNCADGRAMLTSSPSIDITGSRLLMTNACSALGSRRASCKFPPFSLITQPRSRGWPDFLSLSEWTDSNQAGAFAFIISYSAYIQGAHLIHHCVFSIMCPNVRVT